MNKLEKIQWASLTLSEVLILIFIIAGIYHQDQLAVWSLFAAGSFAWIALCIIGLLSLRRSHGIY